MVKEDHFNRLKLYRQFTKLVPILGHKEKSQEIQQLTEIIHTTLTDYKY